MDIVILKGNPEFNPDQPRGPDGRWGSGMASPEVGVPFVVYRLGRSGGGLAGKNGGSAMGVARHLSNVDDFDKPGSPSGDTITAYRVVAHKPFGNYQSSGGGWGIGGDSNADAVGVSKNNLWFSFPVTGAGIYDAKPIGSRSLSQVRDLLETYGWTSFDDAGSFVGGAILEEAFKDVLAQTDAHSITGGLKVPKKLHKTDYDKGNPEFNPDQSRDDHGRWSSGGTTTNAQISLGGSEGLRRYVAMVDKLQGGKGAAALLVAHGHEFDVPPAANVTGTKRTQHKCYQTAGRIAINDPTFTYVEGYLSVHGVPIEHAWLVDAQGVVHDPTLQGLKGVQGYYGIPFSTKYVTETAMNTKYWGIISHTNPKLLT